MRIHLLAFLLFGQMSVPLGAAPFGELAGPSNSSPDQGEVSVEESDSFDAYNHCDTQLETPCCEVSTTRYAMLEALFLFRDVDVINQPVVLNNQTLETLYSTSELDFDGEPGMRLSFGSIYCTDIGWEASYFGLREWGTSATVTGNDDFRIPGDIALATEDFLDADTMQIEYSSELHSAELNIVKVYCGYPQSFQLFGGIRYVRLAEAFNIRATDLDTGTSDYNITTENDLIGVQIGASVNEQIDAFTWGACGKLGLFGNNADQHTFLGDFDNTFVFRDLDVSDTSTSLVGEFQCSLSYQINSCWSARIGYNLLWIDDVALAPNQLDFSDAPESSNFLNRDGSVFLHGVSIGLVAWW